MTKRQTILVAGATGSIGNSAAVALAKRGARVVLLGRRAEKLSSRADSIRDALTDAGVEHEVTDIATLVIDFSDMESVRAAADEVLSRFPTVDGLVLSVGALIQGGPNVLPSGHEVMFATNVMGPFLFTNLLLEWMQQSDGLVLHVIPPFHKALDWNDLESLKNHRPMVAFNRTKTCNRMIAGEPLAELMLANRDRASVNGALFVLDERSEKPDKAMNDEAEGERLWERLELLTEPSPR